MNYWAKISLGVAAAGAIVGIWYADEHYTKKEEEEKKTSSKALNFESSNVRKLSLTNAQGTFSFERPNGTDPWKMTAPKAAKPDQDAVNNLVSAVQSLNSETELEGTQQAAKGEGTDVASYGLDKPRATLDLELEGGKKVSLKVGNDLSVGSTSGDTFNALSTYAVATGRDNVLVVGNSIVPAATKKSFADFRTKLAGDFNVTDVRGFKLAKVDGTVVELKKEGDKDWKIVQPRELVADNNNVSLYLDKMAKLRVDKITEPEAAASANLAEVGLNPPGAVLEVQGADNKVLQTFKLGLTKTSAFVTMVDGGIGTVDMNQWNDLVPPLKHFRDRRVMRGVTMTEVSKIKTNSGRVFQKESGSWYPATAAGAAAAPAAQAAATPAAASTVAAGATATPAAAASPAAAEKVADKDAAQLFSDWEFITAEDVVDGPGASNLAEFGLDKPVTRFSFEFADASKAPIEILVGNRVPKNEKAVYVKRGSQPEVYVVETAWLDVLTRLDGGQSPQAKK